MGYRGCLHAKDFVKTIQASPWQATLLRWKCTLLADTSSGAPLLFAGLSGEKSRLLQLGHGEKIQDYIGHMTVSCIAVSMRHQLVCSGSSDSTVRVYKMSSGRQLRKYNHGDVVTTMILAGMF